MQRILIAASLALAANLASAHVTIAPPAGAAGAYQTLTFKVGHGCDGSATVAITVQLPEGIAGAKPMPKPGWNLALVEGKLATPIQSHGKTVTSAVREITWRGGPLPDAYYDEFVLQVKLPDAAGRHVFKVLQQCEQGRNDWVELPGQAANGKFPAPVFAATGPASGPVGPASAPGAAPAAGGHAGHH